MLFKMKTLEGVQEGRVTLAFRRWRRPTVRTGGSLRTPRGELQIGAVTQVTQDAITAEEARLAGFDTLAALQADLNRRSNGQIYRIELGTLRPDPRIALRNSPATGEELRELQVKLDRLDTRARGGPWTRQVLQVLSDHPEVRAADLCGWVGQGKDAFKRNVRKLKNLGLTESLEVGYRLSPRGEGLLEYMRSKDDASGK